MLRVSKYCQFTNCTIEQKRLKIGKFIGLRLHESSNDILTEEDITEMMRCEREKRAEEETQSSKGKWY